MSLAYWRWRHRQRELSFCASQRKKLAPFHFVNQKVCFGEAIAPPGRDPAARRMRSPEHRVATEPLRIFCNAAHNFPKE